MQEVVSAYKDPGTDGVKQVQSTGLHISGERFVVIKADERSIYGKKVSAQAATMGTGERSVEISGTEQGARGYWKNGRCWILNPC